MKSDLIGIARTGCEAALDAGADQAEAFAQEEHLTEVEVEASSLRYCNVKADSGACVRAFRRGGTGVSRGMGLGSGKIRKAAAGAAEMARSADPDPDFRSLPEPAAAPRVEGVCDEAVAALGSSEAVEWAGEIIEAARELAEDVILRAEISLRYGRLAIANSIGVAEQHAYSSASISVFAIVNRDGRVGSFYEYSRARSLKDLEPPAEVSRAAVEKALGYLDVRKMPSATIPVLLAPLAAYEFVSQIAVAAGAENVQRNRSYLVGKKGEKIASEMLSVVDNPTHPGGISSFPFDAEGVPRKPFPLIDGGALTGHLHNSYTAGKAGEPNTAHANRGGYQTDVGISSSNLQVAPGDRTEKEIIADLNEALYIDYASLSPNLSSGDLSATVDYGWKIEKGEPAYPVANSMIGGNMLDLLRRVEAVSGDFRDDAGNLLPAILIGGVRMAGAES